MLDKWFADETSQVYLVTPYLDQERFEDVCRIVLMNKADDRLENFIVRYKCNYFESTTIEDIKKDTTTAMKGKHRLDEMMQSGLENIFKKIWIPGPSRKFHAKFISCVKGDEAEVFITSANFQKLHFGEHNLETVHYIKTTKTDFEERFLHPLK